MNNLIHYLLGWKRFSAENGLGFGDGGTVVVSGLAVETGGGSGAVNICVAGKEECSGGGVGLGGAVFGCCCCCCGCCWL